MGLRIILAIGLLTFPRNVLLVSTVTTSSSRTGAAAIGPGPVAGRAAITRAAAGIGLYAGAFGITFGALTARSGLSATQAVVLSAVMYTGSSQFALVGVLAAGGSHLAGLSAALLLGLRNAFYGVPVTRILRPRGWRRLWTAHFVVDESTAMAVAQPAPRAGRYAFWATGITLYVLWTLGTLAGTLIGSGIDTSALGLDAAASLGCYGLKLAGVCLPESVLNHPRVQRTAGLLPVAMLTALVVTDLFDANGRYTADWPTLAGIGAGAIALRFGRSPIVVFLLAIATTAGARMVS